MVVKVDIKQISDAPRTMQRLSRCSLGYARFVDGGGGKTGWSELESSALSSCSALGPPSNVTTLYTVHQTILHSFSRRTKEGLNGLSIPAGNVVRT